MAPRHSAEPRDYRQRAWRKGNGRPLGLGLCSAALLAWLLTGCSGGSGGPELAIQVHSRPREVVVDWEFRNTTGRPLWIATGMRVGDYTYTFPLVHLVPPGDLLLLSGDFRRNDDGRKPTSRPSGPTRRYMAIRQLMP
ncbi:hypothetical protein LCGC14_2136160, partial [marine sediment metagenome]